jgi:cytoskeletal protein RodZ
MSLTLGEKLKQAREARGITISEVAEQTRISGLYLENIENNDYRGLPGGIFNKGFVKSYAKYVGVPEQEALQDYANLIAEQGETDVEETKTYRPEVLTDDRTSSSTLPTIIFAAIILGLLAWGAFALVNYLRENQNNSTAANNTANKVVNPTNSASGNSNSGTSVPTTTVPTGELNIQFKSSSTEKEKPQITAMVDGAYDPYTFQGDEPKVYTPKQSVKIRFSKYQVGFLQMTINGKVITLPPQPLVGKGQGIEFEINKNNVAQILQAGAITVESVGAGTANANANTANATPR